MQRRLVASVAAPATFLAAATSAAQDPEAAPTAEEMIEVARETWRAPDCPQTSAEVIVVCAPVEEDIRVESPTQAAIREGERPPGMPSNAMHLFEPPPCIPSLLSLCSKFGAAPPPPLLIDTSKLPVPLTPEEAAHVFRAEDPPAMPAAASPAAAP